MKRYLAHAVVFSYLVAGMACTPGATIAESKVRIAAVLKTSTNPYFQMMWEGIKQEADLRGMQVDLFWPELESDFEYQYRFLQDKAWAYDALLLAPSNVEGIAPYLPPLKRVGKTIIVLDADIQIPVGGHPKDYFDAYLGTDNELGGKMVARFVASKLPRGGTVVLMGGFPLYMNRPGRVRAFREAVLDYDPTLRILEYVANYDRVTARQIVNDHWKEISSAAMVFCANDHMALGVLDAFRERRVTSHPLVTGYDSIREAQEQIIAGKLLASVIQFPARMGQEGIKAIAALVNRDLVEEWILIDPELSVRRVTIDSIRVEHLHSR